MLFCFSFNTLGYSLFSIYVFFEPVVIFFMVVLEGFHDCFGFQSLHYFPFLIWTLWFNFEFSSCLLSLVLIYCYIFSGIFLCLALYYDLLLLILFGIIFECFSLQLFTSYFLSLVVPCTWK